MTNDAITDTVLSLSFDARMGLLDAILQSFSAEIDPALRTAWVSEANSRFEAYARGEAKAQSREDAIRELKSRFQQ